MQIKRNNNIPLSMADALVDLVRRYVIALDADASPHEAGIVRALVPGNKTGVRVDFPRCAPTSSADQFFEDPPTGRAGLR